MKNCNFSVFLYGIRGEYFLAGVPELNVPLQSLSRKLEGFQFLLLFEQINSFGNEEKTVILSMRIF